MLSAVTMQTLRELYRLLQAWRKQDRIRTAPGIGKLLNLEAGRQLLVRQTLYQITERAQTTGPATLEVTYQLLDIDQDTPAQLSIAIELARPTSGVLTLAQPSSTIEIFQQDVTVLSLVSPTH